MKKILITGSRSGIAYSVIDRLKDKNYYIYATTHTEKQAISLKEKWKGYSNIECFKLDITNQTDIEKIKNLEIDILFCNASTSYGGSLIDIDINKVKKNYDVNVFGNLKLIQLFLKQHITSSGKVVIMSSLAGIIPLSFIGSYSSTKASLIKIAEILKKELKLINKNIKICLIEPGLYYTGFNEYMFENKYDGLSYFDKEIAMIHLKETIISKLLSKKNLKSITNQIIKAIEIDNNQFIYRAPFFQVIFVKLYSMLLQ